MNPIVRGQRSRKIDAKVDFAALCVLLFVLFWAGGASRADQSGQLIVRGVAWLIIFLVVFFVSSASHRERLLNLKMLAALLAAAVLLPLLQLIPIPEYVWASVPGRDALAQIADVGDSSENWRPLSISPGATTNALGSLVVPVAVFLTLPYNDEQRSERIMMMLLGAVLFAALIAVFQFSGAPFDSPFLNDSIGVVSGNFANRNHFALFASIGCILTPVWTFREQRIVPWKILVGVGLLIFLSLVILASGSRAGILLAPVGIFCGAMGALLVQGNPLGRLNRRTILFGGILAAVFFAAAIWMAITFDRAVSFDRFMNLDNGQDLRYSAMPVVIDMIWRFFPVGTGFGTFDAAYRIFEPDALLGPAYFNHAHNDFLEVALDGGLAATALMFVAVIWWLRRGLHLWSNRHLRNSSVGSLVLARAGWSIVLLILIASTVDYPVRTPIIMAILVIAIGWMSTVTSVARKARP